MGRLEFVPKAVTCWREGYSWQRFRGDLLAGMTVAVVALPLAMAIAIASGVGPERGLATAIVAGFLISLLGGSRVQIGGPTGAFIVVVASVVSNYGYSGLATATFLAGALLLLMGFARLGNVIAFIPYPVTTGFTTGIAVIIFSSQVNDFFGLGRPDLPGEFIEKWAELFKALPDVNPAAFGIGFCSLTALVLFRRYWPKLPGALVVVAVASIVAALADLPVETVGSRFGEIPRSLPAPSLPALTLSDIRELFPVALTIALLAGIESLLSAVVADGMTGGRHRPNAELVAQGVANLASVTFGGIPATGAIARTAMNIKSGGKTPVAGIIHAALLLIFMIALAPLARYIPLASLAAMLFLVAWNMSELEKFFHLFHAPRSDVLVMLTTFFLTVLVDLTLAVQVGVVLAALLFIKRMRDVSELLSPIKLVRSGDGREEHEAVQAAEEIGVPDGVEVFELAGPFFFGVADRLRHVLDSVSRTPKVFILRMRYMTVIDATGMYALQDFAAKCRRQGTTLLFSGVQPNVLQQIRRSGLAEELGAESFCRNVREALLKSQSLIEQDAQASAAEES